MRLVYQSLGTASYVGMESNDEKEIIEQYYSFWNHGATSGKLHWMSDTFAYISTSPENLWKYFGNSSYHLLLNNYPDTWEGQEDTHEFQEEILKLATKRYEQLKENTETFHSTNPRTFDYSLGKTEARQISTEVQAFDEEAHKQGYVSKNTERSELLESNNLTMGG